MPGNRVLVLKKLLKTLVNPLKWGGIMRQTSWLLQTNLLLMRDIAEKRRFSSNPNSKRYWNRKLGGLGNSWRDDHYHFIVDLLPHDQEFALLDVGCALGDGCALLKQRFPRARITGVDISDVGIEKARSRSGEIQYQVLDITCDPIPGLFDYITIVETLEHFDDPFAVIDRCLKNTRRMVIVCVPYRQNLTWTVRWGKEHRTSFDENTFARYSARVAGVTDFLEGTGNRYIVYEIRPPTRVRSTGT
jgi:SAM-dependent methyltransferase